MDHLSERLPQFCPAMPETTLPSDESPTELRQWCYGKESVIEYVSSVAFKGPFHNLVAQTLASYETLIWSELPGTNGRYRAALARTETIWLSGDLGIRVYLEQRYNQGNAPSSHGIDASIEILGRSSLAGVFTDNGTREVWKFSQTVINPSGYSPKRYCFGAEIIPLSQIYGSASQDSSVTLSLTFRIKEPANGIPKVTEFPTNILLELAENLISQGNCDIEFVCKDGSLYAISPILKARSDYFTKMFAFDQLSHDQDGKTSTKSRVPFYERKATEEPFDLLHTILYYLYTDRVTFSTNPETNLPSNLPKLCPAEDIYLAADRMCLNDLKEKALNFLKLSCTTENITSRVLSSFADVHAEVGTLYTDYFRKNWDRIKMSEQFDRSFEDLDVGEERRQGEKKFRELMRDAVFLP